MSYKGHVVVDTDCHLREYWELDRTYKDTMDPEYRDKYARFSEAVRSRQARPGDVGFPPLFWPGTRTVRWAWTRLSNWPTRRCRRTARSARLPR